MPRFTKFFKQINKKLSRVPKLVVVGLIGVAFLYISAAGSVSITYPWLQNKSTDQIAHIDMIWRLWNGQIPNVNDGVRYPPFVQNGVGNVYQRAAGHPPLYHIVMAPFMGPSLNKGEYKQGIAIGRAVNIGFGILTALALAWAGWLFGGKRRALFAVAVPALGVLTYRYSRVNTDLSMDGLLTLWCTLTMIFQYKILQQGLRPRLLIILTLLSAVGLATKASYAVFILISIGVIIWAARIHGGKDRRAAIIKGSVIATIVTVISVAAIGWYYYVKNYKASGSLVTPIKGSLESSRPYQSYLDIITGNSFWALFYARITANIVISTLITSFAVAGYFMMEKLSLRHLRQNKELFRIVVLLALGFLGIVATQIKLAHPQGSLNYRYLLPATLPISMFLAWGLLEFRRLRWLIISFVAIAMAWMTILSVGLKASTDGIPQGVKQWTNVPHNIIHSTAKNGLSRYIAEALLAMFAVGAVLLILSFYRLDKPIFGQKKTEAKN